MLAQSHVKSKAGGGVVTASALRPACSVALSVVPPFAAFSSTAIHIR